MTFHIICVTHRTVTFVAGAAFGDLGVSLFMAGTVFGETWVDSRSATCSIFQYKMRSEAEKGSSASGRGQFCNFMSDVLGSWSDHGK